MGDHRPAPSSPGCTHAGPHMHLVGPRLLQFSGPVLYVDHIPVAMLFDVKLGRRLIDLLDRNGLTPPTADPYTAATQVIAHLLDIENDVDLPSCLPEGMNLTLAYCTALALLHREVRTSTSDFTSWVTDTLNMLDANGDHQ